MPSELLDIHLQLLVLQYGRARVLNSLAHISQVTPEVIEAELARLLRAKATKPSKTKPSHESLLNKLGLPPEKQTIVALLVREYDNKRFLGELRLVDKFLRTHGHLQPAKSRDAAFPKVLSMLANMPFSELQEILSSVIDAKPGSEYSNLAGAIMNLRRETPDRGSATP